MESLRSSQEAAYRSLLTKAGSLSGLFSESDIPYLHYRAAEKIYCRVTQAENLARADIAYDARIGPLGIGLKTFICTGDDKLEKIAEFNRLSSQLIKLEGIDLARRLAELRNRRIELADQAYGIERAVYHIVSRRPDEFIIFEVPYVKIDIDSLTDIQKTRSGMTFRDKHSEYSFTRSKSTLYKRFTIPAETLVIPIAIAENPFDLIRDPDEGKAAPKTHWPSPFVILPLYTLEGGEKLVPRGGPLHQAAAGLPVPAKVNLLAPGFFPDRGDPFALVLPNGAAVDAWVEGGVLRSEPEHALSDWLRRGLANSSGPITYEDLEGCGTDSVRIEWRGDNRYAVSFAPLDAYEEFIGEEVEEPKLER